MKNVTTKSIILFFILCFSTQLPILAQGNSKQTKYIIKNAWWTNKKDMNKNGYPHKSKLHFDVDVSSGQHTVYAKIFYKFSSLKSYTLYYTTPSFTITGKNKSDAVGVIVGEPNVQLFWVYNDNYDFMIKIYEYGSSKILATWGPSDDWDLKNKKFETFDIDYGVDFLNMFSSSSGWTKTIDKDNDGFASYRLLTIRKNVFYKNDSFFTPRPHAALYYKPSNSTTFTQYSYLHVSNKDDFIVMSLPDDIKLPHNLYDFRIRFWDRFGGGPNNTWLDTLYSVFDNSDQLIKLNNIGFETDYEDVASKYIVLDAWWSSAQDKNGDGYNRYRKLHFNVDAINGGVHDMYAKIYYKTSSSNSYTLYYTTPSFTITGKNKSDTYWIGVGPAHIQLPKNIYDFKIDIYKNDGSKIVRTTLDPSNDPDLNDKKFEKISEDEVAFNISTYKISGTWWTDAKDRDSDGYTRYRRLHFNVDVSNGTQKVYAKIYYKTSSSNSFSLYYTTPPFPITGNKKSDNYWIAVGKPHTQPPHNIYDFKIEIYAPGSNKLIGIRTPSNDSGLANNKFEKFSEDPFPK